MPSVSRTSPDVPIAVVAKLPLPGTVIPENITFTPDDRMVTFLFSPEGSLTKHLYAFDLQNEEQTLIMAAPEGGVTEENLSIEDILRRERTRQTGLGIASFAWAAQASRMLVPQSTDLYILDEVGVPPRKIILNSDTPVIDPQLSPDGCWIAYVQDGEVYVVSAETGGPSEARQITWGAREVGMTHGLAEYVAQEEMGRGQGFWWSPDSQWIAFEEVDDRHIPVYRIVHQGKDRMGEGAQEDHHYPFSGQANAKVRLGIVGRDGGEPTWMDLDDEPGEYYLARVNWLPDGNLAVQLINREQNELVLTRYDPTKGKGVLLLRETSEVWINLNDLFFPLKSGHFIWGSERTGYRHLYLYDENGSLVRSLTSGEWVVDSVTRVDEAGQQVYFLGNREHPTETRLYAVSLDGGEIRCLTPEVGTHSAVIDHGCKRFIDIYQSTTQPPLVRLRSLESGEILRNIYDRTDPRLFEMNLRPPELISLQNRSGVTLYGAIFRPPQSVGEGPFPTIVQVYGGPQFQMVANHWGLTTSMRAQYLASLGYLVFMLDNRGSSRRGIDFEAVIRHRTGWKEVEDQVDGVRWLVAQGLADADRVGIYGWSYGGYMAAACLERAPEIFKAAVSGAPVTQWDAYDTFYTERYMGTPQSNPQGYFDASVLQHVDNIQGHLLLIHGLIDENVHFRNTARWINALIKAHKPYELVLFPDERHLPRKEADRLYMEERIRDFFLHRLPVD